MTPALFVPSQPPMHADIQDACRCIVLVLVHNIYDQGGQGFGHRGFGQGFGHVRNAWHETMFWAPEMPEMSKTINLEIYHAKLAKDA